MFFVKHILNSLLILAILFGSLRISFTYIYYYLDPSGFTEKLCENKDRPELECNGKCYLKEVVTNENQENKTTLPEIEYKDLQLFLKRSSGMNNRLVKNLPVPVDTYENRYQFLIDHRLFHPPKTVI